MPDMSGLFIGILLAVAGSAKKDSGRVLLRHSASTYGLRIPVRNCSADTSRVSTEGSTDRRCKMRSSRKDGLGEKQTRRWVPSEDVRASSHALIHNLLQDPMVTNFEIR